MLRCHHDGEDVARLPYIERKARLEKLVASATCRALIWTLARAHCLELCWWMQPPESFEPFVRCHSPRLSRSRCTLQFELRPRRRGVRANTTARLSKSTRTLPPSSSHKPAPRGRRDERFRQAQVAVLSLHPCAAVNVLWYQKQFTVHRCCARVSESEINEPRRAGTARGSRTQES